MLQITSPWCVSCETVKVATWGSIPFEKRSQLPHWLCKSSRRTLVENPISHHVRRKLMKRGPCLLVPFIRICWYVSGPGLCWICQAFHTAAPGCILFEAAGLNNLKDQGYISHRL